MVSVLSDLRSQVVTDVTVESRDLHEVLVEVLLDFVGVWLDAVGAMLIEADARIGDKADRLQAGMGHDGLEHVELEVALRTGKADCRVVTEHAGGDHRHGLALGRIDFARHDRRAGLVFGDQEFADTVAGARRVPADVIGNLHEGVGEDTQRPRNLY